MPFGRAFVVPGGLERRFRMPPLSEAVQAAEQRGGGRPGRLSHGLSQPRTDAPALDHRTCTNESRAQVLR